MPRRKNIEYHDALIDETIEAWNWFRCYPEAKKKYTQFKKDFKNSIPPSDFFEMFGETVGQKFYRTGVSYETLSYGDIWYKSNEGKPLKIRKKYGGTKKPLRRMLTVKIDSTKPINVITQQIEEYLKEVHKAYKIKPKKVQTRATSSIFKACVLLSLGKDKREIKRIIRSGADTEENRRKSAEYIIKKAEGILEKK